MLKNRILTSIILIPCTITTLLLLPLLEFKIIILLICMLSTWEWGKLSHLSPKNQKIWLLVVFLLLSVIFQTSSYQSFSNPHNHQNIAYIILIWWFIALLLILFYPNSAKLWNKSTLLWLIFGASTILPFFWGVLILKIYEYNENNNTTWWLLYAIILVWGMDSFSYIIGKTLGYHQATPKLSPYKTWEGYIGGVLITTIIFLTFFKYIPIDVKFLKLLFYSVIIIISSILGDLTASMFKRESGIKDSSQLIPGHGGILDTIDSLYSTISILASLIILNM